MGGETDGRLRVITSCALAGRSKEKLRYAPPTRRRDEKLTAIGNLLLNAVAVSPVCVLPSAPRKAFNNGSSCGSLPFLYLVFFYYWPNTKYPGEILQSH